MAAESEDEKYARHQALFEQPTIDGMLELTPTAFQDFVGHVFTCAGYIVEDVSNRRFPHGPGVDLNLYVGKVGGRPITRVEVRRWARDNLLHYHDIADFIGVLHVAGGIPGYCVTTSGFHDYAITAAEAAKSSVRLIDGDMLLRYIAYVGGSRLSGEYAGGAVAPVKPTSPAWLETADDIAQRTAHPPRIPRILAVANTKGGVAKTTTALNIAFSLADRHRKRVLLVDLDGQASVTRSVPRKAPDGAPKVAAPPHDTTTLAEYFRGQVRLSQVVRETRFANLWAVPAHHDLYRLQFAGADRARYELKFVEDVRKLELANASGEPVSSFDWIILDTPAGNSFYARAALAAADYILIPALAETYAVLGIEETLRVVRTMAALMGDSTKWRERVLGCVITRWKPSANADKSAATIRLKMTAEALRTIRQAIPVDDRVETAHRGTASGGIRTIFGLTSKVGPAAVAYDAVVEEILEHVTKR